MLNKELKEIKNKISRIRHPRINKILASEKIDTVINKVQKKYHKIFDKLVLKYNFQDELKQGKIYTLLIALLAFMLLIVITLLFTIALNSIIGVALFFSIIRQIVFCIKLGYTIIKNKGKSIKKYLANLFPNSKILKDVKERRVIPLYEEEILYQIEDFLDEFNKNKLDLEIEKEITLNLKEIVNMLNINNLTFKDELKSLEFKRIIANKLADISKLYQNNLEKNNRKDEFLNLKNDVIEQINQVENKVYVKKISR